jgi:gas vesicle protein
MRRDQDDDDEDEDIEEEEAAPSGLGAGSFAAGLAIGALVGATVALLLAPAPGRVTRKKLKRHLEDARELAEEGIDELGRKAKREIKKHVG